MLIYFIAMIAIGVVASRRVNNVSDLYVGGFNVGGLATALSFFTTYFSSVIFVGATAIGWKYGLAVLWKDVFVVFIGTLAAFTVIGPRLLDLSRRMGFTSVVEFIEKRYRSRLAGGVAAVTMFVGLYIYCISILVGMAKAMVASMDVDYVYALLVSTIVTLVYVALGGYIAQIWTQAVQAVFMLTMAIAIGVVSLIRVGGFEGLQQNLLAVDPSLAIWPYKDLIPLFTLFLSLGFMGIGNPALVMKFITVKNRVSLRSATLMATITVTTLTLSLNVASAASRVIVKIDNVNPDHSFIYLTKEVMPMGFDVLLVIAILAASMSTLAALLNTLTHISKDLVDRYVGVEIRRGTTFFRIATGAIALTAMLFALNPPEMIIVLFGTTTAIISSVLVGPIVYGLFWRRATATGAIASMISSFAIAIAVSAYGNFRFPWTYYAFLPAITASMVILPIVSLIKKPSNC